MSSEDYNDLARLVTFRPLSRPIPGRGGGQARFTAEWSSTVRLLARELRLHGARRKTTVLEMDFRESDLRIDGLPRADRNARSAGIVLGFKAHAVIGQPDLRYEVASFSDWRSNVRALAMSLEALRAVDRYGVTTRGEQYRGWQQIEAPIGEGNAGHGRELISAAGSLAEALKLAHPDHGGAEGDFRDVIAARDAS